MIDMRASGVALRRIAAAVSERGAAFRHVCGLGLEGIVSKRKTATYVGGRSRAWQTRKCPDYQRGKRRLNLQRPANDSGFNEAGIYGGRHAEEVVDPTAHTRSRHHGHHHSVLWRSDCSDARPGAFRAALTA
jgi:hypothetical protein